MRWQIWDVNRYRNWRAESALESRELSERWNFWASCFECQVPMSRVLSVRFQCRLVATLPVPGPRAGWWSPYRRLTFLSLKIIFVALRFCSDLLTQTLKCFLFISNFMSRSKLFSVHFLIRLGNRRTLERRTTTFPVNWYFRRTAGRMRSSLFSTMR